MTELVSRKDAIAKGLPRYFTGKSCSKGHTTERYVVNKTCCECGNTTANKAKAKNPDKYYESNKVWRQSNPDKSTEYTQKYVAKNKGKRNLWTANYRNVKVSRMPSWLSIPQVVEIESIYEYCSALRQVGLDYHVDHIVPLRGETVSGLHVPWNLRVIPGSENMSKGNRFNG